MMPTQTVSLDELKSPLTDLISIALEGDEVIITQDGKPLVLLLSVIQTQSKKKRIAGLNRGSIWTSLDFDDPLPDGFWTTLK
jgi:prevent-host-death family protein